MITREQIVNAVMDATTKYPILSCYLFGSYARDEQTKTSDVDLIIEVPDDSITYLDLEHIQCELSEKLDIPVDLKTMGALNDNPLFYKYIQDDLIEIFNSNQNKREMV